MSPRIYPFGDMRCFNMALQRPKVQLVPTTIPVVFKMTVLTPKSTKADNFNKYLF